MSDIVSTLLNWAVVLSTYPPPDLPPRIEFKPHDFFVENVCVNKACKVLGWYNDQGTVYFDERLKDARTAHERSIWVHEFVHYLQHVHGHFDTHDCVDRLTREKEAYIVQRAYMIRVHGIAAYRQPRITGC